MIVDDLKSNFEVIEAVDGEEALQKATTLLPDLVILDIALPKLDGITVCKELRNNEATRHIAIIMLT